MSRTCLRRFRLGRAPQLPIVAARRDLHASTRCQGTALDLPSFEHRTDTHNTLPSTPDPREQLRQRKLKDLTDAVKEEPGQYGYVWGCYIDLLNLVGPDEVPLELHQMALRRCAPNPYEARAWLTRRLAGKRKPHASHTYEVRFRAIIYNMRAAGYTPSLDDYHYILRQFSAVGHHVGVIQVLRELFHLGIPRTPKTYGLCLMTLCHRLSLPCWYLNREDLVKEISKIAVKLLKDMWEDNMPVTATNLDLAIRIFKETMDVEGFERTMKVAHGIDFAYPDRPPVEFWDQKRASELGTDGFPARLPEPLPFSTAALNTTIDFLGSSGQISRLVQAFEVLTTPLPVQSIVAPPSTYEDDEDEDFGDVNPSVAPFTPPYASPNSTTYYFLLKWMSRAGRASLARHYLLQAMELDRTVDRKLRGDCILQSPGEILAPHFAVNRSMILPIFGEANRDKNMELLRWVLVKAQRVLRRKRADIMYYMGVEQRWREAGLLEPVDDQRMREAGLLGRTGERQKPPHLSGDDTTRSTANVSSPVNTPIFPSGRPSLSSLSSPPDAPKIVSPSLELDLDAVAETPPPKVFDVYKHLSILHRDKQQLELFERHVIDIIGRNTQRVKERLGRRVWGRKDVYLRDSGMRIRISRTAWREIVNFRPERVRKREHDDVPDESTKADGGPGQVAAFRGFFTSKTYADRVRDVASAEVGKSE